MFRRYVTPWFGDMKCSGCPSPSLQAELFTHLGIWGFRILNIKGFFPFFFFFRKYASSNYGNVTQIMSILRKNWDYLFNALKYNYTQEKSLSKHTLFFSQPKTSPWKVVLWNVFWYEKRMIKIMFTTQLWFPNFSSCLNNIKLLTFSHTQSYLH